ncbi:MAG: DUF2877 domain-containing protein [Candidatus Eremiobacteraeota bacterium]|nr:DUF2877 domain-containing protein [Candidatus Eremiobacteraeota bacterium]
MNILIRAYDVDVLEGVSGSGGEIHSIYENAISLRFGDTLLTMVENRRGRGPGFIIIPENLIGLIGSKCKPGDIVKINLPVLDIPGSQISLNTRGADTFDSLMNPKSSGLFSVKIFKDNLSYLKSFFLKEVDISDSILCELIPSWKSGDTNRRTGTRVTPVWRHFVKTSIESIRIAIKNKDEFLLGEFLGRLVGMGWGLTPGGDDFVLGMLGITQYIEKSSRLNPTKIFAEKHGLLSIYPDIIEKNRFLSGAINQHLPRYLGKTNFISGSYLKYALDRRYLKAFNDFLDELFLGNLQKNGESIQKMIEFGATSGLDIIAGVLFVLE